MDDTNPKATTPQEPAATFTRFDTSHEAHDRRHFERHGTHIPPLSGDAGDAAPPKRRAKRGEAAGKADAPKADAVETPVASAETSAAAPAADAETARPAGDAPKADAEEAAARPAKRTRELKPTMPKGKAKGKRGH